MARSQRCTFLNDHEGNPVGPYGTLCDGNECDCWCHLHRDPTHKHKYVAYYSESFSMDEVPHTIWESCKCGMTRKRKMVSKPKYKVVSTWRSR